MRSTGRSFWSLLGVVALLLMQRPAEGRPDVATPELADLPRTPAAPRARDAIVAIEAANAGLRDQDRRAKYCKMAASPFAFYRGTNHLFWRDLAGDPRFARFGNARTRTWLLGDAHVDNIGFYDNDEGTVVYDLNDFDEVVIADYQWDLWRMATSIVLHTGERDAFSPAQVNGFLNAFSGAYLDALAGFRDSKDERNTMFSATNAQGQMGAQLENVERKRSRKEMLDEWTVLRDSGRVFDRGSEDLAPVDTATAAAMGAQVAAYAEETRGGLRKIPGYFAIKDIAARANAGLGSLGVPRYYVLIEGRTGAQDDDRILDVKQQGPPSGFLYLRRAERARMYGVAENHAARSILGYRALMTDADDHLGWMRLPDGYYSVRERSPYKKSLSRKAQSTAAQLTEMAAQWGRVLASAHARADRDHSKKVLDYSFDEQVHRVTRDRRGEFQALVRGVARQYAARVHADHRAFGALVNERGICR